MVISIPVSIQKAKRLPKAYNGCRCACHRQPGVKHCFPCCGPNMPRDLLSTSKNAQRGALENDRV